MTSPEKESIDFLDPRLHIVEGSGHEISPNPGWEQLSSVAKVEKVGSVISSIEESTGFNPEWTDRLVADLVEDGAEESPEADKQSTIVGVVEVAKPGEQPITASELSKKPPEDLADAIKEVIDGGVPEDRIKEVLGEVDQAEKATQWIDNHIVKTQEQDFFSFDGEDGVVIVERLDTSGGVPDDVMEGVAYELARSGRISMLVDNADSFRGLPLDIAEELSAQQLVDLSGAFDGLSDEYLKERIDMDDTLHGSRVDYSKLPASSQEFFALEQINKQGWLDISMYSELPEGIANILINSADVATVGENLDKFTLDDETKQKVEQFTRDKYRQITNSEYLEAFPEIDHTKLALRQLDQVEDKLSAIDGLDELGGEVLSRMLTIAQNDTRRGNDVSENIKELISRLDQFTGLEGDVARQLASSLDDRNSYLALGYIASNEGVFADKIGEGLVESAKYVHGIDNLVLADNVARVMTEFDAETIVSGEESVKEALYARYMDGGYSGLFEIENSGEVLGFDDGSIDKAARLREKVSSVGGRVNFNTVMRYIDTSLDTDELLEQASQVVVIVEKIAHSRSVEVASFAEVIVPLVLEADDPQVQFDKIEKLFTDDQLPTALTRLEVFNIVRPHTAEDLARYTPGLRAEMERGGEPLDLVRSDLLRSSIGSNSRSLRNYLEGQVQKGGDIASWQLDTDNPSEILRQMDEIAIEADKRGRELARRGDFKPKEGDLIKGVARADKLAWLPDIMQSGSLAKEFLGAASDSDLTPLDTDLARVGKNYPTLKQSINNNMARGYGDIYFVLQERDGRWSLDSDDANNQLELISHGGEHYGIRTGFATSEVDYMVLNDNMKPHDRQKVYWEIAKNGFYIPVVDVETGSLVFTPEQYDNMREQLQGASEYGSEEYRFSDDLESGIDPESIESVKQNQETVIHQSKLIQSDIESTAQLGSNISIIDTGSTGRGTNIAGGGDYDLMMLVDPSVLKDDSRSSELRNSLRDRFTGAGQVVVTGEGNLRIKDATVEGVDSPVDIDITFAPRTNNIHYTSEQALADRFGSIRAQSEEKYYKVLANVVQAKQVLKEAGAYKTRRSPEGDGGLGGIGVENWILQHGGSLTEAARSFLDASSDRSFEEFIAVYSVFDSGQNHVKLMNGQYPYDNFIADNMSTAGYEKMKQVCRNIVNSN